MKMQKRGISPLIATVLLIGFTVALAAVVMTWGLDYIRGTTENVGAKTEQALSCAGELSFEIVNVDCATNSVQIQNNGALNIANLTIRLYKGGDIAPTVVQGIGSLGVKTYDLNALASVVLSGTIKVDAVATIMGSNNKPILCNNQIEEYTLLAVCP